MPTYSPRTRQRVDFILNTTATKNDNRVPDPDEIGIHKLKGDGDFRSEECIKLLKQADIVVTNPSNSRKWAITSSHGTKAAKPIRKIGRCCAKTTTEGNQGFKTEESEICTSDLWESQSGGDGVQSTKRGRCQCVECLAGKVRISSRRFLQRFTSLAEVWLRRLRTTDLGSGERILRSRSAETAPRSRVGSPA